MRHIRLPRDEEHPNAHIASMAAPSTPCIGICVIAPASGLCEGCGRTLAEVAGWGRMAEPERRGIMAGLPERMRRAGFPVRVRPATSRETAP